MDSPPFSFMTNSALSNLYYSTINSIKIDHFSQHFKSFHKRIKLRLERTNKREINFLDISLSIIHNKIITYWYHKDTWSGKYLNYHSYSQMKYKKIVINSFVNRAMLLTSPGFHNNMLNIVRNTLLKNCYSLSWNDFQIKKRIKQLTSFNKNNINNANNITYFKISYHLS